MGALNAWRDARRSRTRPRALRSGASSTLPTPTWIAPSLPRATAFDDGRWSNLPPNKRERIINKLADLIEAHAAEFAELEAIDDGQTGRLCDHGRRPGLDRSPALHGRLGLEDQRGTHGAAGHAARQGVQLRHARAGRRRRADHSVEFPADHGDAEDLPGACRRLHADPQARGADFADGAAAGRPGGRGRLPARRDQRHHRQRPHGRAIAWSGIRTSTRSRLPARPKSARSSTAPPPIRSSASRSNSAASRRSW